MTLSRESHFRIWLAEQNRWSSKAQNDLVSRLKRADRLRAVDAASSVDEYLGSLEVSAEWIAIPRTSRTGMVAAVRLYLEWKERH